MYKVDTETFEDVDSLLDWLFDPDGYDPDDDDVEEWINDTWYDETVRINGAEYHAGEIVRACNDSEFEDLKNQYAESLAEGDRDEWYSQLDELEDGDYLWINGWKIYYFDEDPDDEEEDEDAYEDNKNAFSKLFQTLM